MVLSWKQERDKADDGQIVCFTLLPRQAQNHSDRYQKALFRCNIIQETYVSNMIQEEWA